MGGGVGVTGRARVPGIVGVAVETNCVYYREIHRAAAVKLPAGHSPRSLLDTLDVAALAEHVRSGDDSRVSVAISDSARRLELAGADFVVISSSTGHLAAPAVRAAVRIPLLDVRGVAAAELRYLGVGRVGLVSTVLTQRRGLYDEVLTTEGIQVLVPDEEEAEAVDEVIFGELIHDGPTERGVGTVQRTVDRLIGRGAEAVLLACTDLTLLAPQLRADRPLLDTTVLHARVAGLIAAGESHSELF
jgi:amino-acid racemase